MKTTIIIVISLVCGFIFNESTYRKSSEKYQIDLPEEIQIAKVGDSLTVYRISDGVIYIGFKH